MSVNAEQQLAALATESAKALEGIKSISLKQDEEIKTLGAVTDQTAKSVKSIEDRIKALSADIEAAKQVDEVKEFQARLDAIERKFADRVANVDVEAMAPLSNEALFEKISCDFVTEAKDEIEKRAAGMSTGNFVLPVKGGFLGSNFGRLAGLMGYKTQVYTQPTLAETQRMAGIIGLTDVPSHVRDIIPVRRLTSNAIEWLVDTVFDGVAAGPTPGTGLTRVGGANVVADGDEKPETVFEAELLSRTVKTIAAYINLTNQTLRDLPVVAREIETRLLRSLAYREDQQLLYGAGTGANISGLTSYAIQEYDWSSGTVGDTRIDALRRALTLAWIEYHNATAILIDPNEWEEIQLTKASDGHYLMVQLQGNGLNGAGFFAVPVIPHTAVAAGTALIGDFRGGATIWEREGANIRMSDQHDRNFTKNLTTIRAEEALLLQVVRPEAFVEVTFDSAPAAAT